jgi:hypothetical protein
MMGGKTKTPFKQADVVRRDPVPHNTDRVGGTP